MNRTRRVLVGGALAASTLLGGGIGAALLNGSASAQTSTPTTAAPSTTDPSQQSPGSGQPPANFDPSMGGHTANGVTETLLTGDTAEKVKAAALAAVPGGTVQRVENDAEGSPYEAHMTKADGSHVTVKVDSSFNVTSTENGPR
jgi:ABC-type transport system substrate-binding protein